MRTAKFTALALILAGCGGGSDDTAVSANPPASPPPVAATPSPAPSPAEPPGKAPEPAPAPIPTAPKPPPPPAVQPAPQPPAPVPAPQPAPSPAPAPPAPPPVETISGDVLRLALTTHYNIQSSDPALADPRAIGSLSTDPTNQMYGRQAMSYNHPSEPFHAQYIHGTGPHINNQLLTSTISLPYMYDTFDKSLAAGWGPYGRLWLERSEPFRVDQSTYVLDRTLAQWDMAPWFVQLQVQSDPRSNTIFRLCWHYRLPEVIRLSCGLFDRFSAQHRGVYIVDDSDGLGAKTWTTPPS